MMNGGVLSGFKSKKNPITILFKTFPEAKKGLDIFFTIHLDGLTIERVQVYMSRNIVEEIGKL